MGNSCLPARLASPKPQNSSLQVSGRSKPADGMGTEQSTRAGCAGVTTGHTSPRQGWPPCLWEATNRRWGDCVGKQASPWTDSPGLTHAVLLATFRMNAPALSPMGHRSTALGHLPCLLSQGWKGSVWSHDWQVQISSVTVQQVFVEPTL